MRHSQDVNVLGKASNRSSAFGGLRYAVPVAIAIALADQATKRWALGRLTQGPCSTPDACVELIGGARFHLTFNTGAAFKSGEGLGPVIGLLVIAVSVVVFVMAWRRPDRLGAVLLGGVAGGAIGNLADRVLRAEDGVLSGAVVDFIEVVDWYPIFNIADAAIVGSVILLIAYSMLRPEAGLPPSADNDDDASDVDRDDEIGSDDDDASDLGREGETVGGDQGSSEHIIPPSRTD